MSISCTKCGSRECVKNGFVHEQQWYKCKDCLHNFICGDARSEYDNETKNLVVRMYLNNCGFSRISHILNVPFATCFSCIKNAGKIVDGWLRSAKNRPKTSRY